MAAVRDREKYFTIGPNGVLGVNKFRRDILPVKLALDTVTPGSSYPITIQASGTLTPPKLFKQPYNAAQNSSIWDIGNPFIWQSASFEDSGADQGTANADWTIFLKNNGRQRQYSNLPLHIRTMFGTAKNPTILREPLFFAPNDQIACYLNKISGAATTARLFMNGTQYASWSTDLLKQDRARDAVFSRIKQWKERQQYVAPYWLTPNPNNDSGSSVITLAGDASGQYETIIPEDSHFEAFCMMVVSTGNFSLQITEVKTRQMIMNGEITKTNAIGNNAFPTLLPTPYLIPAGYNLRFSLTDLSSETNSIYLVLHGRRIWAPLREVKEVLMDTSLVKGAADQEPQMVPKPLI